MFFLIGILNTREEFSSQHMCSFSRTPQDVLNRIAFYLSYSNTTYETDELFLERTKKSQGLLQEAQISNTKSIKINNGRLEVIPRATTKLIADSNPEAPTKNFIDSIAIDTKELMVSEFVLSPAKNFLGAVIESKTSLTKILFFTLNKLKCTYEKVYTFLYAGLSSALCISNNGQVILGEYCKIFSLEEENNRTVYKKIHEEPAKYIGPFLNCPEGLDSLSWVNTIVALLFNKQGTKLGLKFHYLYEVLLDEDKITNDFKYNEIKFKELITQWYSRNCNNLNKASSLIDTENISLANFLNEFNKTLCNQDSTYYNLFFGIDEACPVKIISVQKEEPWTLAKYFQLRGVCKNLHKQCGRKE